MSSIRRLVLPLIAGVVVLTGCTTTPAPSTPFDAALLSTPATAQSQSSFSFTDVSRAAAVGAYEALTPDLLAASTVGYDAFSNFLRITPEVMPDPDAEGATATSYGVPPDNVTRFTSVADPTGVFADSVGERTEVAEGTLLERRDDYEIDLADEEFPASLVTRLNSVWYAESTLIAGTNRAMVEEWATFDGESLGETLPGLSACIGDPIGALVLSGERAGSEDTVAIGVSETADGFAQTLCLRSDDAERDIALLEENLASGMSFSARPFSDLLGAATVQKSGDEWVRMTSEDATPGAFFTMAQNRDLELLLQETE